MGRLTEAYEVYERNQAEKRGRFRDVLKGAGKGLAGLVLGGVLVGGAGEARGEVVNYEKVYQYNDFTSTFEGLSAEYFNLDPSKSISLVNNNDFTYEGMMPSDRGWTMCLFLDNRVIGSANNGFIDKQNLGGRYIDMEDGDKPTGAILSHTPDLNRVEVGIFDTDTLRFIPNPEIEHYVIGNVPIPEDPYPGKPYGDGKFYGGIGFNGSLGDLSQLPAWSDSVDTLTLPTINAVEVPELSTLVSLSIGGLGLALRKKRK
ncbi:MAG: hypothetical protein ACP5D2_04760 [Candidatus Nanoarchaeia archaeon]